MVRCIICGELCEGTEEHIVPKSLGNHSLVTNNVCKTCNSGLGTYVDSYFTSHFFIEIIRRELGLKGQSGRIPNPFREGVDENGRRVRLDDEYTPVTIPSVDNTDEHIRICASTKKEIVDIMRKVLKRKGISDEKCEEIISHTAIPEPISFQPTISFDFTVDINKFRLEALKIAYEYACYVLGDSYCWKDEVAEQIRLILYQSVKNTYSGETYFVNLAPKELSEIIRNAAKAHSNIHVLSLNPCADNKLIATVILFMQPLTSFQVLVSDNAKQYEAQLRNREIDIISIHGSN